MIVVQFVEAIDIKKLPIQVKKAFKHNTYLLDCDLRDYDVINFITSNFPVLTMYDNNDCAYNGVYERRTGPYTTIHKADTIEQLLDSIDAICDSVPGVVCIDWQMDRNYLVDFRISELIRLGNTVVCSGGNDDLPVMDLSPIGVDGVLRVGGGKHNGKFQNWIDIYDITVPEINDTQEATHHVCQKLVENDLELDYCLDFYSESHVRSAPWPKRLLQTKEKTIRQYEFLPVSNLRYIAGEHILPSRPGDQVSVLSGSCKLIDFYSVKSIELTNDLPRGITFNPTVGWLYGTFKYKENMFHRIVADINGVIFEYHIISCDADNKLSYSDVKEPYFNRPYDAPPFTLREYWVPMSKPVKLLEPGDPFIRTYNLNDLHLYRSYE